MMQSVLKRYFTKTQKNKEIPINFNASRYNEW